MISVLRVGVAVVTMGLVFAFATADASPTAHSSQTPTYKKCGVFRYRGKHALFARRYPCGKAQRKARFVLRHRRRPPHWKCSLAQLRSGFAACHRGHHAWEFVPA